MTANPSFLGYGQNTGANCDPHCAVQRQRPRHRPESLKIRDPRYWHIFRSTTGVFMSREHGHHDIIEMAQNAAEKILPVFLRVGWRDRSLNIECDSGKTLTCASGPLPRIPSGSCCPRRDITLIERGAVPGHASAPPTIGSARLTQVGERN